MSVTDETKKCPRCAELIKREAIVCRFCGAEFTAGGSREKKKGGAAATAFGCGLVIVALALLLTVGRGPGGYQPTPMAEAGSASGRHCLDASIGGLHPDFWYSVKRSLDDPDSMKDEANEIGPVDSRGFHRIRMTFRAKNAYGAYQVSEATGRFRNSDCSVVDIAVR